MMSACSGGSGWGGGGRLCVLFHFMRMMCVWWRRQPEVVACALWDDYALLVLALACTCNSNEQKGAGYARARWSRVRQPWRSRFCRGAMCRVRSHGSMSLF